MSLTSLPLVSIGMPVYNEARFLRQSIDALITQDYPNIELIISDNASTDETEKICHEYVSKYDWISFHHFEKNQGPALNFEYVLKKSKGSYFMWAAGHDLWDNNYLTTCINLLESHPNAIIAYGASQWINEHNKNFGREFGWVDTRGMDIIARYFTIFWGNMHPILGVIRKQSLQDSPIINTVGADLILLSNLILKGDFIHSVETQWKRREFRVEKNHQDKLDRYKSKDYRLTSTLFNKLFPLTRLPFELIKVVFQAKLSLLLKCCLLFLLIPSFPIRYIAGKRNK